jgi:bacillolysin
MYTLFKTISIDTVDKFSFIKNTSGASRYTNFTPQSVGISANDFILVTLIPGYSGSSYTEYWKILIDYNKDGDFKDYGVEVLSKICNYY